MPREAPSGAPCGIFVSASSRDTALCTSLSRRDKTVLLHTLDSRVWGFTGPHGRHHDGSEETCNSQDWPQCRNRSFHHGRRGAQQPQDAHRPDVAQPLPLSPAREVKTFRARFFDAARQPSKTQYFVLDQKIRHHICDFSAKLLPRGNDA